MKISETWLREWVPGAPRGVELGEQLTMAGLEIDSRQALDAAFDGVVVAQIREIEPHPDAQRLRICQVDVGDGALLQVVCGAPNARAGLKAPLARVGARLPGDLTIRQAKLRGVASSGMLCAAAELGLIAESDGLLELPPDAPIGVSLQDALVLPDAVLDINLTPNRGDCFSILGVARELAALNDTEVAGPVAVSITPVSAAVFPVTIAADQACPRFAGRVIRGIDPHAHTPLWMRERLRRCGMRAIHPVVDITNYVMLELGQPLHGYDLAKLAGGIEVRLAAADERLALLDGREVELADDMLVIADGNGPVGLAGIMGGISTAVSAQTQDVFFEAAHFAPAAIAGRARRLGLHTDASLRFERGVDPQLPVRALERATELLLGICGGQPGPVDVRENPARLVARPAIDLRAGRLRQLLGVEIPAVEVERILSRLGMRVTAMRLGWQVEPPSFRFDIALEEDLIEEVARIHGYDRIPRSVEPARMAIRSQQETRIAVDRVRDLFVDRGYREAITYSFVDQEQLRHFTPDVTALRLANPISADMNSMRTSLWPGLLAVAAENVNRQQNRVRLFEIGNEFHPRAGSVVDETMVVAGLALGDVFPEQWGVTRRGTDFFDVKGDLTALLALGGLREPVRFVPEAHAGLHPGQSARIVRGTEPLGWIGALHPRLTAQFGFGAAPMLFRVDLAAGLMAAIPAHRAPSRFPSVRRDLALLVEQSLPVEEILQCARRSAGDLLTELRLFDVYRGDRIESGRKSIALGLILQADSRTLTDQEVDHVIQSVVSALQQELGAKIRD